MDLAGATSVVVAQKAYDHDHPPDDLARSGSLPPVPHDAGARAERAVGQAAASASCAEAANASGPCSAAAGSIHMTCQPWPSRS